MEDKKNYSDGTIEKEILYHLEHSGTYKEEELKDGAIFHNFTKSRENLFNWYPFKKDACLLEIGAGMGALTGLFCEKCDHVVAIEPAPQRAEIIRKRYSEKKNLDIVCEDIFLISFEKKFDYIVVAGVLEYAAMNNHDGNAYLRFLNRVTDLLKTDGVLLLAIENRFGLKYWCGTAEDHTGIPFDGISGYEANGFTSRYDAEGVRTFGKKELGDLLDSVGLVQQRWYYPLPDYKFPMAIFSDEKLPEMSDIDAIKFTYSMESELVANEKKLYKDIIDNEVFPFFANSYLVEARSEKGGNYYVKYATLKRDYKDKYRIGLLCDSENRYIKIPLTEQSNEHLENSINNLNELEKRDIPVVPIYKNEKLIWSPQNRNKRADVQFRELLKNNNKEQCLVMLRQLKEAVEKSSTYIQLFGNKNAIEKELNLPAGKVSFGNVLKNGYIDMTFANSFYDEDSQLCFFDQEWNIPNMPINFILYRSLKYSYDMIYEKISRSFLEEYLDITKEQIELFDEYEICMLEQMMNKINCQIFDKKMYHDGLKALTCAKKQYVDKVNELDAANDAYSRKLQECDKLKDEINWLQIQKEQLEEEHIAAMQKYELETELLRNDCVKKQKEINEKQKEIDEKQIEINSKQDEFSQIKGQLEQEVRNKIGHIELLLPAERELIHIKKSKMFKIMRFVCRGLDIILFVPKYIVKKLLAFIKLLSHVNIPKLKIAAGYVKNEGIIEAYHHLMRDYHQGELKELKVEVQEEQEEILTLDECEILTLPLFTEPVVSIVIPVYNQFAYTYHCIESIIKNTGEVAYEVILADDCSTDLTTQIKSVVKNLNVVKTESNLRFLRNCNNAAKTAKGQYILFLNNDTQVQKDWLQPLVDLCERDAAAGMVGSKLVYSDGSLQEAGGIIWRDGSGWNYGRNDDAMKPEYNYVREAEYISGASIMIRRKLWEQLGGFDELFAPAYCEDSDLAFQVRKAGYKVLYQPLSVVVHFEGKSNGTDLSSGVKKYQVENNLKLRNKWKDEFDQLYDNGQCVFKARERGKGKKTILVIDHYVPQFDKDAGSKTTYQYLRMFVEQGYLVKFMGDNFYQDEPYTTVLQQMGIEVLYGPWYAQHWKEWIKENQKYIDFVYLNRPHITMNYIDFLKQETNIKCIYYGHDLHFLRLRREYELTGNSEKLKESEEWMEKELYIMKKADISYYPSYIEEQAIHEIDSKIPVKAITAYVYDQFRTNIPEDFEKREGIMFVGGFGHPPNEDAVLWFVENVYPIISKEADIPFYIVGSKATEKIKKLHGGNIYVKGFVSEEELNELYDSCKLVVVPLRYGAGVKGKVVEALYYGTPMVTTSVGAEGIAGIEKIVEISDEAEDFSKAVLDLYRDNQKLKETVKNYQKFVREKFSIDAVWNIVKEDFE